MIDKNDIYSHLLNGGNPQDLLDAFMNELNEAQKKVDEDKKAKAAEDKKNEKAAALRKLAVAALLDYFALVNPNITEKMITSVLETLESVKIRTSKSVHPGSLLHDLASLLF